MYFGLSNIAVLIIVITTYRSSNEQYKLHVHIPRRVRRHVNNIGSHHHEKKVRIRIKSNTLRIKSFTLRLTTNYPVC